MKFFKLTLIALVVLITTPHANCQIRLDSFVFAQYGKNKLYLDRITSPSTEVVSGKKAVLIFLFGGGWEGGNRKNNGIGSFFNNLALNGYTVVPIDYRLGIKDAKEKGLLNATNGTSIYLQAIDMAVEDLYLATRYVLNHAKEWKIDPKQIVIMGGSSGATNSIVAEYGICNNTPMARKYLPADFNYAGIISMAGALWLEGEETKSVWARKPCPFLFFIGNKDQLVTYNESHSAGFSGYGGAYLSKQFTEMGVANWFYDYVDGDHVIAAVPVINRLEEIGIFLKRFIAEKKDLYLHTIEKSKEPTDFGHAGSIFTDDAPKEKTSGDK